jgi:2-oxoglutarate dehydrogenase E2 component (dihydrolipoamide succinyltransferase)
MVPVRNAENLSFRGVEADIKRLAKARDGQITVDDMTGGTFTITNGVLKYVVYPNY